MSVELRPVTKVNFGSIIDLEVSQDQVNFVASNLYSIAESKLYPECIPLAIYANETPVGFLMYAFDNKDDSYWICRLMIDRYFKAKDMVWKPCNRSLKKSANARISTILN